MKRLVSVVSGEKCGASEFADVSAGALFEVIGSQATYFEVNPEDVVAVVPQFVLLDGARADVVFVLFLATL
jgi:hypothetical protein